MKYLIISIFRFVSVFKFHKIEFYTLNIKNSKTSAYLHTYNTSKCPSIFVNNYIYIYTQLVGIKRVEQEN